MLIEDELTINLISIEDLVIDRLNAYKYWHDKRCTFMGKSTHKGKKIDKEINISYLQEKAKAEGLEDAIEELINDRL